MLNWAPWTHHRALNGHTSWTHLEHRQPFYSHGSPHWYWNHRKWQLFAYHLPNTQLRHSSMNATHRQLWSRWWHCWQSVCIYDTNTLCTLHIYWVFFFCIRSIVCILCVNCYSVNLGMAVQNVFTTAKMIAVMIVIAGGAFKLYQGNVQYLQNAFSKPAPPLGAMAAAFYTGLWAYDGWNNLNYVTEEIQNPSKWVMVCSASYRLSSWKHQFNADCFCLCLLFEKEICPDRSSLASRWSHFAMHW